MSLHTKVVIPASKCQLNPGDKVVFLGSCFAENIGKKYPCSGMNKLINPLGIAFNPFSLLQHLIGRIDKDLFIEKEKKQVHFSYHSKLNADDETGLTSMLLEKHAELIDQIKTAHSIFISYGTAWYYRHRKTQKVVCNNHKAPINLFEKGIFSMSDLKNIIRETADLLQGVNPEINIVFTVSPVKHLRDGLIENSRSKANLISAVHEHCSTSNQSNYFPSYEVVNDELRDYRFYAPDMVHPSELAQDLIYHKVQDCFFNDAMKQKSKAYEKLNRMQKHKTDGMSADQMLAWREQLRLEEAAFQNQWATKIEA